MAKMIKYRKDGKLCVSIESTNGFPGIDLVNRKLDASQVCHEPAGLQAGTSEPGDRLLAFIAGSPTARQASRLFGIKMWHLPASGYRIEYTESKQGNCLVIAGGDLFGMLAGLSDTLLWSELTKRGLVYRGGNRTENPVFPLRFYWTWDHSTNWVLDDPGNQVSGCRNQYLKQPETYLEDYRRLVNHCIDMRFNGIVIWGFLRDAHGGEPFACEIARYAADRGVAIMPGIGTTGYGGIYYEGRHPCNLETYLAANPRLGNMSKDGSVSKRELSPYYPENQEWLRACLEWLYRTFPIGGVNLENSDLMVDHSHTGKRGRTKIKSKEADYFKDQYFAYKTALETIHKLAPDTWNAYATYSGFGRGKDVANAGADMGVEPYFAKRMPESAIAQWTLSGMLSAVPASLRDWMHSSKPKPVYQNPRWPKGLEPPTPRSAGYIHQATQWWSRIPRNCLALSTFAEACLRASEAGLEGIGIHGEVTSRTLAWKLNYLTMRHWTYHPVSTLEEFAYVELNPRLGGKKAAHDFVEILCLLEENKDDEVNRIGGKYAAQSYPYNYPPRGNLEVSRMWRELIEWARLGNMQSSLRGFSDIL